jgi:hypothetical protein
MAARRVVATRLESVGAQWPSIGDGTREWLIAAVTSDGTREWLIAAVMRRVDDAADHPLLAYVVHGYRGGDGRHMSTLFAEGRGGETGGGTAVLVSAWQVEVTA